MNIEETQTVRLKSFEEYKPDVLGEVLNEVVSHNAPYLETRRFIRTLEQYGDSQDSAIASVAEAQLQTRLGVFGHFAVIDCLKDNEVIGVGLVHPGRLLRKQGPIRRIELHLAAPYIRAWVGIHSEPNWGLDVLAPIYSQLSEIALSPSWRRPNSVAWTLEPVCSDAAYHEEIRNSGLRKIAIGAYDDGEINRGINQDNNNQAEFIPPQESILYAAFYGECVSYSPRRKEHRLRKARKAA